MGRGVVGKAGRLGAEAPDQGMLDTQLVVCEGKTCGFSSCFGILLFPEFFDVLG